MTIRILAALFVAACARPGTSVAPNGHWVDQPSGVTASLRGVSAAGERVAWASGARNSVLRTVDGGATWERRPVPGADSLDFRSVRALDERVAYVASAGDGAAGQARIYRTADGGATWTLVLADTTKGVFFDALAFWDANHGLALSDPVGGRFVIVATDDGGRTWRRATTMPDARPGEAAFAAGGAALTVVGPAHAWFATGGTGGSRIFHSADGGRTWSVSGPPGPLSGESAGFFAVAFRDARTGVAVGGDYRAPRANALVARTTDGGQAWILGAPSAAATGYWSGLAYATGRRPTLVAVGGGGTTVSADDGRTWTKVDSTELNGVSFAGGSGWAVGPRGRIVRWRP